MQLNEDFLHFIWQYRLLSRLRTVCSKGESLYIIDQGQRNSDAGPDFSMARLEIGGQLWIGNVEIHLKSSDWLLHGHQSDTLYNSVILHAVYDNDQEIVRTDGSVIPVLILRGLIPEEMLRNYQLLLTARGFFPCCKLIGDVKPAIIREMLNRMVQERLIAKAAELQVRIERSHYDWSGTFYFLLLRGFGFKINSVPFEILADNLQLRILFLHRDNPLQVNALLFGMAGFLEGDFKDQYPMQLQAEYLFLKQKYNLSTGDNSIWKFMRIRPQNFPVLRIAQLAALFLSSSNIFAELLDCADADTIRQQFHFAAIDPYWQNHSHFDRLCKPHPVSIGRNSLEHLIINSICLFLYCYGTYHHQEKYKERALELLFSIRPEHNIIIAEYARYGVKAKNALDSQALLQLNKEYCSAKKCLNCTIGRKLIGDNNIRHENYGDLGNKHVDLPLS
jgi:hypothetical protein